MYLYRIRYHINIPFFFTRGNAYAYSLSRGEEGVMWDSHPLNSLVFLLDVNRRGPGIVFRIPPSSPATLVRRVVPNLIGEECVVFSHSMHNWWVHVQWEMGDILRLSPVWTLEKERLREVRGGDANMLAFSALLSFSVREGYFVPPVSTALRRLEWLVDKNKSN